MLHLYGKAIHLLLTTPRLWITILCPILVFTVFSLLLIILLFVFALYPQVSAFQRIFPDAQVFIILSWFIGIFLVCLESAIGIMIMSLTLRKSQDRIFDFVLKQYRPEINSEPTAALEVASLSSQISQLVSYMVSLPIGLIPFIGPVLYVGLNGYIQGPMQHKRYFKMKKWSEDEINGFVHRNRSGYTTFGIITSIIELIPIVNLFGFYLNTIVSALYAVELDTLQRT